MGTAGPHAAARMPLLDAAKGVACLLIVGHHLSRYGPLPAGASSLAPQTFDWLAQNGRLAVQVFLVLAGFLAAGSLAPRGVLQVDRLRAAGHALPGRAEHQRAGGGHGAALAA
jgi:peptidoglycan/LPS O-acetylase OafA/YrhL